MGILALVADERVADMEVTDDELIVRLMDGRAISVPLVWYPRLLNATEEQRKNWRISGGGYGIHWEDIDEDLSTEGLLRGMPATRQSSSAIRTFQAEAYTPSDDIQDDQNDQEKGILDFLVEGEEAGTEMVAIMVGVGEQITDISSKIERHTLEINNMGNALTGAKPMDLNTVMMLVAADITTFSKGIEEMSPKFKRNVDIFEKSILAYISLVQPEDSENIEQLRAFKDSLSATLDVVRSVKENVGIFKDVVQAASSQAISGAVKKATNRQSKALDGLIASIEEFVSFALRINFQIEEKLGHA
jgi:hypothetical protein